MKKFKDPPLFRFRKKYPKDLPDKRYAGKWVPELNPEHAFYMHETFGLPVEIYLEEVKERLKNQAWFENRYAYSVAYYQHHET